MNTASSPLDVEFRHFHLFCGLGGGARGFNRGHARVGNLRARFRCIGGIDNDAPAIEDFTRAAGVAGTVLDLFSREQYRDFHGKEPPADWREATPQDLHRAAHFERPNIIFLSAPCKGFSGLLPESSSKTNKYQALNGLTLRGVWLMMEAWKDDPPELVIFENVPRIENRGRHLLDQICAILREYGYAVAETKHDCGEIGGLAQSRKRFLLVARHEAKVPPFLYQPEKKSLRGVGEILEKLPLPGDGRGGPMHRMPALQWQTWVRLAFVEAGADWRSLNKLVIENGVLRDFGIVQDWHKGVLGVNRWSDTAPTISSRGGPTNGRYSIADPRVDGHFKSVQLGVRRWGQSTGVVTGNMVAGAGPNSVADPRLPEDRPRFNNVFRIVPWNSASPSVAGPGGPAGGLAVADPRPAPRDDYKQTKYRVTGYNEACGVVISASTTGNGAYAVADPRTGYGPNSHRNKLKVVGFEQTAGTVTGSDRVGSGALSVADPRPGYGPKTHQNLLAVMDWNRHAKTATGAKHPAGGALSVADPRTGASEQSRYKHSYRVIQWNAPGGTVTAGHSPSNGALCVADPRPEGEKRNGAHGVREWTQSSGTVAGDSLPSNGAYAVADPRPIGLGNKGDKYKTAGAYGVVPWMAAAGGVNAHPKINNGSWSIADPRDIAPEPLTELPKATDRLVAVIRALDGSWHRPFTTLELAALQSLFDPDEEFALEGKSDSAWRERIGNAVPSDAAQAIAGVMGQTLLLAMTGETFMLSNQPIWVQPVAMALAVDQRGNIPDERQ